MKLSLSVRIAEAACKTRLTVPFAELIELARELGYRGICMRASAGGIQTPRPELERMRNQIESAGLVVSMVTADCDVPLNNDSGPASLRNITPTLDVAESLGATLVRVCLKQAADIDHACRAADEAAKRGMRLAHQCHTTTLFETADHSLEVLRQINRPNFGLIFEPANLYLCGQPYGLETIRRLQPYLMNVYLQNHRLDEVGPVALETWCLGERRFHHIPMWERGGVDFEAVIDALNAVRYDGFITVHQAYAELMGPHEAAAKSADYLRRIGVH